MAKLGDRVVVEGSKVGSPRREGTIVEEIGRMIRVRWTDGQESLLTPGPGSLRILPGNSKAGNSSGSRKTASPRGSRTAAKASSGTKRSAAGGKKPAGRGKKR